MPTFQMGKITQHMLKIGLISSSLLLSACELDDESNSAPVFGAEPVTNNVATVGQDYNAALSATDPDGDVLLYTMISGPSWLTVNQNGTLSGTHSAADVGMNEVIVSASDGNKTVETTFTLVVEAAPNNLPTPASIANTLAYESLVFNQPLTATDADADPLTFSIINGPDWLTIIDGVLQGTPAAGDLGTNDVVVAVTDGIDIVKVTLSITVEKLPVSEAPGIPTININTATEGLNFSATLSATDAENDTLTFTLDEGSADWLTLNGSILSGTPGTTDVGPNEVFVIVSDGINTNPAETVTITVSSTAPTNLDIAENNGATEDVPFNATLSATTDTSDDVLTFSIESGPSWLSVDGASGVLSGTPAFADIGINEYTTRVTDFNGAFVELTFDVQVAAKPLFNVAPEFKSATIFKPGDIEGSNYADAGQSIALNAFDNNNDILTFSKTAGPDWLVVASDGTLSGTLTNFEADGTTPASNTFTVEVSDGSLSATATLNITKLLFPPEELTTATQAVGRQFSASIIADNGFGTDEGLTFSRAETDTNTLFNVSAEGNVTSTGILTASDTGVYSLIITGTNGIISSDETSIITITDVYGLGTKDTFDNVGGTKATNDLTYTNGWGNEKSRGGIAVDDIVALQSTVEATEKSAGLRATNGAAAVKHFTTVGYSDIVVTYDRAGRGLEDSEDVNLIIDWSIDGITWQTALETVLLDVKDNPIWLNKSFILPPEAEGQEILSLRFNTTGTKFGHQGRIDNIIVSGTAVP
ncbi:putative Ig domain-containing protein [Thalassotalea fonticola]|uniref:Ig domain-containing protein n=1 Tax=Thalassotalea fonticola TaxID=3065649 RepID=A0ABZ0GSD2_9GAMM|nr:putative Ig domain-containing protein [Colwelliaceae bacterium S1-1]